MNTIDFYLYRIKFIKPVQLAFYHEQLFSAEIFARVLNQKPSLEIREGIKWHIGNVRMLDDEGGYFAIGRTTKSMLEKYNTETGDFTEEVHETSPYTHVYFDNKIGLIAIAKKSKLSSTPKGIANKVMKLFQSAHVARKNGIKVLVDHIPDPYDFISSLRTSYRIRSFTVTFTGPNPFDADEFFQKPMEKYLAEANGDEGKTTITGENLKANTLVVMTKSVAATGNDAKARLKAHEGAKFVTKSLSKNPAFFGIAEEEIKTDAALAESRNTYERIRGSKNDV